jgi:hypothetical protein
MYIPAGCGVADYDDFPELKMIVYYTELSAGPVVYSGAAAATQKAVTINGGEGLLIDEGDVKHIIWHNDERIFNISGLISEAELIKIAENVMVVG